MPQARVNNRFKGPVVPLLNVFEKAFAFKEKITALRPGPGEVKRPHLSLSLLLYVK